MQKHCGNCENFSFFGGDIFNAISVMGYFCGFDNKFRKTVCLVWCLVSRTVKAADVVAK